MEGRVLSSSEVLGEAERQRIVEESPGSSTEARSFEWIAHNDVSARKRARAHVTRGVRREKAAKIQPQRRAPSSHTELARESNVVAVDADDSRTTITTISFRLDWLRKQLADELAIPAAVSPGRQDPFIQYPIEMDAANKSHMDHFFFIGTPEIYGSQPRSNSQVVMSLLFSTALTSPSAFHVLLACCVVSSSSTRGIKHYNIALKLITQALVNSDSSDESLTAVAFFLGFEMMLGSSQRVHTHQAGLIDLLKLRGGLESIKYSNPTLYFKISWVDYQMSCSLLCRRRMLPAEHDPFPLSTPSHGIPKAPLQGLPTDHDLYRTVAQYFQDLLSFTRNLHTGLHEECAVQSCLDFITRIHNETSASLSGPKQGQNLRRRQHILHSFETLAMIYKVMVPSYAACTNRSANLFLDRLQRMFEQEHKAFGEAIASIFSALMTGNALAGAELAREISCVIDASVVLELESWVVLKVSLLEFLREDAACKVDLETMRNERMACLQRMC